MKRVLYVLLVLLILFPLIVKAIDIAEVVLDTSNLTSREGIIKDSLEAWGYNVTIIDTANANYSNLSAYNTTVAIYQTDLDSSLIDSLISNGNGVALIYSAGMAVGGTWSHIATGGNNLVIDTNTAFLEGYGLGTGSYQCDIYGYTYYTSAPQSSWISLGHIDAGQFSALYKENNGKGAIFGYDPFYYAPHGYNIFKRIIKYVSNETVVTGITIPANNVGFVIASCDDITPALTNREETIRDSLVSMGYTDITYIGSDKTTVSDYSQAKFVISAHNYMGLGKPDSLIDEGVNVALIYSAGMAVGGTWNNSNTQKLYVESNEAFLGNYSNNDTLNMQSAGYEYFTEDELTGWTTIGHTPSFITHKTAIYRERISGTDTTRGGILSYDPVYYTSTGNLVFKDLILWAGGEPPAHSPDISVNPDTLIFLDSNLVSDTIKTMVVYNTGNADLNVTDITKSEAWIKSATPSSFIIAPNDSVNVTVIVNPNGLSDGTYYAHLSISSNDPDENPYLEQVKFVIDLDGIKENKKMLSAKVKSIYVYPNPFNTIMTIDIKLNNINSNQKPLIGIYDVSGNFIRQFNINNSQFTRIKWDGKDKSGKMVKTGIYFVKIQTLSGNIVIGKKIVFMK